MKGTPPMLYSYKPYMDANIDYEPIANLVIILYGLLDILIPM